MCNTPGFPPSGQAPNSPSTANTTAHPTSGGGTTTPTIVVTPPPNDDDGPGPSGAPTNGSSSATTPAVVGGHDGASDPSAEKKDEEEDEEEDEHKGKTVDYHWEQWYHPRPQRQHMEGEHICEGKRTYYTDGTFKVHKHKDAKWK